MGFLGFYNRQDVEKEFTNFNANYFRYITKFQNEPCSRYLVGNSIYTFFNFYFKNQEYLNKSFTKSILKELNSTLIHMKNEGRYEADMLGTELLISYLNLILMTPKSSEEVFIVGNKIKEIEKYGLKYRDLNYDDVNNYCNKLSPTPNENLIQIINKIKVEAKNNNSSETQTQKDIQNVIALWDYTNKFGK